MKPLEDIRAKLISELKKVITRIEALTTRLDYYNEILGNTSFLLVALLGSHLRDRFEEWNSEKWMDDSLITTTTLFDDKLVISGVAIWGVENDTEQWTEPFYFEIRRVKDEIDSFNYAFLFGDQDNAERPYKDFRNSHAFWNDMERDWKYIIKVRSGVAEFSY